MTSRDFERAMERAHATEQWGEYTIVIVRLDAHVEKGDRVISIDPWRTRPYKRRVPVTWVASAWRGGRRHFSMGNTGPKRSRAEACSALRLRMRRRYDEIPDHIERIEAEYARLREALR